MIRHAYAALAILTIATCSPRITARSERDSVISSAAIFSAPIGVRDRGATGDGVSDDRAAIQSALDAAPPGSEILIPNGRYLVGKGSGAWCLTLPPGITLRGESRDGVVLVQAPGIPGSVRLLEIDGASVTIESLTLDGDSANQTPPGEHPDEHRAGVFSTAAGTVIRDVTTRRFTGDGLYFYTGSDRFVVEDVLSLDNERNGMTIGGASAGGRISGSTFRRSRAEQVDSEPGATGVISDLEISGSTLDGGGVSTDYVLTISGGSPATRAHHWDVHGNEIDGGVHVVWADQIVIRGNTGTNPTARPHVSLYRSCSDDTIEDNDLTSSAPGDLGAINVTATAEGGPERVVIRRNRISGRGTFAVRAEGGVSLEISDNDMTGPGTASPGAGIYLRATDPARPLTYAVIRRNRIRNFGSVAVKVQGNGAARLSVLDMSDNVLSDDAGTMLGAFALNDGTGAAVDVRESGTVMLGGCTRKIVGLPPAGSAADWAGQRWLVR